jgi:polyisoprenoid-binding protein YceI
MKKITLLLLLSSSLFANLYLVNNSKSYVGFGVKNMLLPYTVGQFKRYTGSFTYDEKRKKFLQLDGIVKTASVHTESDMRDEHLRSEDFFEVKKHPNMTLKLVRQRHSELVTKLTIKGITKRVIFALSEVTNAYHDKKGNLHKSFILKATINRQDFNVVYNTVFGPGEKMIADNVDIELIVEGIEANY